MELVVVVSLLSVFVIWNWLRRRYYNKIRQSYEAGDYTAAIRACDWALRISPRDGVLYYNRALMHLRLDAADAAQRDFEFAIQRTPQHLPTYLQQATLYIRQGRIDDALASYQAAIEVNPEAEQPYLLRAMLYGRQGNLQDALRDNDQAIELIQAALDKAEQYGSYITSDKDTGALKQRLAYAYANRASIYANAGHHSEATTDYDHSIELLPDDPILYANRAEGHISAGALPTALDDYATARQMLDDRETPLVINGLAGSRQLDDYINAGEAVIHFMQGATDRAQALWRRLLDVDARFADSEWVRVQLDWSPELQAQAAALIATLEQPTAQTEGE